MYHPRITRSCSIVNYLRLSARNTITRSCSIVNYLRLSACNTIEPMVYVHHDPSTYCTYVYDIIAPLIKLTLTVAVQWRGVSPEPSPYPSPRSCAPSPPPMLLSPQAARHRPAATSAEPHHTHPCRDSRPQRDSITIAYQHL